MAAISNFEVLAKTSKYRLRAKGAYTYATWVNTDNVRKNLVL